MVFETTAMNNKLWFAVAVVISTAIVVSCIIGTSGVSFQASAQNMSETAGNMTGDNMTVGGNMTGGMPNSTSMP
jgi:hypothetical protein